MPKKSPKRALRRRSKRTRLVDQYGSAERTQWADQGHSEQSFSHPSPYSDESVGNELCESRPEPTADIITEPYVLVIARMHGYISVEDMERNLGPEAVVREFMRGPYDPDDCMPAADCISRICPDARLTSLEEEDEAAGCDKIALVYEASLTDGDECSQHASGPLSALDLSRKHFTRVIDTVHDQSQPSRFNIEATNTATDKMRMGIMNRTSKGKLQVDSSRATRAKAAQRRM